MVTLLKFSIANSEDSMINTSSIINMLEQLVPISKEHRWQLFEVWFNLISILVDKIVKVLCYSVILLLYI